MRMADDGLGDAAMEIIRDRHGLFYMQAEMLEPIYFKSLPEPIPAKAVSMRRVKEAA
jgi:hypothetical protein